jgi:predicted RNA-binding Zn-ribbon protein involved in translation (DUF1610 family)
MMVKLKKQQDKKCEHTINLATVDSEDGSFACPRCGLSISPDDETEDNYEIMDTKIVDNELAELDISCGKCGCLIKITGLQPSFEA